MNVLLLQLDGKIPNIALMRLAYHHRNLGHAVTLRRVGSVKWIQPELFESSWDLVYGSLIFQRSRHLAEDLQKIFPHIILGGTGWDVTSSLEAVGVTTIQQDYSDYDNDLPLGHPDRRTFKQSLGFTQRGCRLRCGFCVVPKKEGAVREEQTIAKIWRGEPYAREVLLLDNDFFGQPSWRERIEELHDGKFKVSFNQGINARMLTDETAAAIASVDYRDDSMRHKRIYTAFDNFRDHDRLFAGLESLKNHGVKPGNIMVYMLIGYKEDDDEEWNNRRFQLREFGCMPYPMAFVRNPKTIGFQRYVIGNYDRRVSWAQWKAANYDPKNVGLPAWLEKHPELNQNFNLFDESFALQG